MGLPPEANTGGDIHSAQTSGVLGLSKFKSWEMDKGNQRKVGIHLFETEVWDGLTYLDPKRTER